MEEDTRFEETRVAIIGIVKITPYITIYGFKAKIVCRVYIRSWSIYVRTGDK